MAVRTIILSAYGAVLLCAIIAPVTPQYGPSSDKTRTGIEKARSNSLQLARRSSSRKDDDDDDDRDDGDEAPPVTFQTEIPVDEGRDGVPPLPLRAIPPSLRNPKMFAERVGPPPPPKSARRNRDDDDDDDDDDAKAGADTLTTEVPVDEGQDGLPPLPLRAVPPSLRNPKMFAEQVGPPPPPKSARRNREDDDDDDDEDMRRKDQLQTETPADEGENGIPPLPPRAVPPSLRNPKEFAEPVGPPAPPQTWSDDDIADAEAECKTLLGETAFDFNPLRPIRDGACGAPAPIQLKGLKQDIKVDLHPPATMTCPLASALGRWVSEVVQPRAKALLETDITQIADLSAYQCRSRYNDSMQRISYHAFAEAVDIAAFVTAKGERISVLDHWPGTDKRAQFLKEIHDGACKIFGTVLGPEANAAHKNHFHLDVAKRRHSAFCE